MLRRLQLLAAALLGAAAAFTHNPLFLVSCGCMLLAAFLRRPR